MMVGKTLAVALAAAVAGTAVGDDAARIRIDFGDVVGEVKPVNGIGQGPLVGWDNYRLFALLKEAGIPYARLHDVGGAYGGNRFVDVPNVFRDFDADEDDPKSYDFSFTDSYLKALVDNGVEPYYRLGVTIENASVRHGPLRILPPKDFAKWARICEHIVRHYTQGWANGFNWRIRYWEIWNEPEDCVDWTKSPMWRAPFSEYCRLYEVTSKHLKAKFPDIRVGGYAGCGFYAVTKSMEYETNPVRHERFDHLVKSFHGFLAYVKEHGCPLDFFSFHCYDDPVNYVGQAAFVRRTLDDAGFAKTEMHCNEWLSQTVEPGSAEQAPRIAAMLAALQEGPTDAGMIYDGQCRVTYYAPLFDASKMTRGEPEQARVHKSYYAFLYFNELRRLGKCVRTEPIAGGRVWATAATDGKGEGAVLLANDSDAAVPLDLKLGGWRIGACRVTDPGRTDELTVDARSLPPHSFMLMRASR